MHEITPAKRAQMAGEPAEVIYLLMMDKIAELRKQGVRAQALTEMRKTANMLTPLFGEWQRARPRSFWLRREPKPLTQEQFEQRADKYRVKE